MSPVDGFELTPTISTEHGPVRGAVYGRMHRWLGIPYASPPIDYLRWRPPVLPERWTRPVLALAFKSPCAQDHGCFPGFAHPSSTEDCLYLNVFAPSSRARPQKDGSLLPVMVWIPGGGLVGGAASDYDPVRLVCDGNVVFVSVDYRLGLFGFFSHPAINAENHESGNYGFMDQQAALRWVRANIHLFGGDRNNVTIFGESAGGYCVATHLASPSSRGLFHKAIIQSGAAPFTIPQPTVQELEPRGVQVGEAAGCSDQSPASLRAIPTFRLLEVNAVPAGFFAPARFPFGLMGDDKNVPYRLPERFARGEYAQVPLIMGVTKNETNWFQAMEEISTGKIVAQSQIDSILERYPISRYGAARRAIGAAISDAGPVLACYRAARIASQFGEVYLYEFDVDDAPVSWPKVSFSYDSAHTQELQFLFHHFCGGAGVAHDLSESHKQLMRRMVRYWTDFARSGSPNGNTSTPTPTEGGPQWPSHEPESELVMSFRAPMPSAVSGWARSHLLDFWDDIAQGKATAHL